MTRNRNVADVQSNGISAVPPSTAGKNAVINGGFDIWQRGTSFVNPAGYFVDRFTTLGSISNITFSQQTTGAPSGSRYILRATATGASAYSTVCQMIETNNVVALQGLNATYTIKLRVNSTFNATGLIMKLQKSATVDAGTGATWTDISTNSIALASLPTTAGTSTATYYTGTITAAIPNDGTANSLRIIVDFNGGSANGSIVEYAQAQLEAGSTATPFSRNASSIQGELAACQRYYQRVSSDATSSIAAVQLAFANSTTGAMSLLQIPAMRTVPTIGYSAVGNFYLSDLIASANYTTTAIAISGIRSTNSVVFINHTVASGLTSGRAYSWQANTTSTYFDLSAEL